MLKDILYKKAEIAFREAHPEGFRSMDTRIEVLPNDGTMLLFTQRPKKDDPLLLLRHNAKSYNGPISNPVVVDPETGQVAKRYAISFRYWARPEMLHTILQGQSKGQTDFPDWSELRLIKGIPQDAMEYRYGRSGRLTLILDRQSALLAAQVFPGGLLESGLLLTPERIKKVGWILLARSGLSTKPYSFHILRGESFFDLERAIDIPGNIGREDLKSLEIDLIKNAEEDRKIIKAMLLSRVSWEFFKDGEMI